MVYFILCEGRQQPGLVYKKQSNVNKLGTPPPHTHTVGTYCLNWEAAGEASGSTL